MSRVPTAEALPLILGLCLLGGTVLGQQPSPAPSQAPLPPQPGDQGKAEAFRAYVVPEIDLQPVQTQPDGAIWERNPSLAFRKAKALQRPLLLLFTARWNEGCQQLSEEVFSSKTFNSWAKEEVVLCFLDYPQNYNSSPESMKRVKERYEVRGYPNLLIFNPKGEVIREIKGYRPGRPVDYFNQLEGATDPLIQHLDRRREELSLRGFRVWTNQREGQLFARFVRRDSLMFTLQGPDGEQWTLPMNTLKREDHQFALSFPGIDELAPAAKDQPKAFP